MFRLPFSFFLSRCLVTSWQSTRGISRRFRASRHHRCLFFFSSIPSHTTRRGWYSFVLFAFFFFLFIWREWRKKKKKAKKGDTGSSSRWNKTLIVLFDCVAWLMSSKNRSIVLRASYSFVIFFKSIVTVHDTFLTGLPNIVKTAESG